MPKNKTHLIQIVLCTLFSAYTIYMLLVAGNNVGRYGVVSEETILPVIEGISYLLIAVFVAKKPVWMLMLGAGLQTGCQLYYYLSFAESVDKYVYTEKEMYLLYAIGYGCVLVGAIIGSMKKVLKKEWKMQWLCAFPMLFAIGAVVHRIYYLKGYFDKAWATASSHLIDMDGYRVDYGNIVIEITLLLLFVFMINTIGSNVKKEDSEKKNLLIPATMFGLLAGWAIWEAVFISIFALAQNFLTSVLIFLLGIIVYGVGALCIMIALLRKNKGMLIIGAGISMLYVLQEMYTGRAFDVLAVGYILGYACIIATTIVSIIRKEKDFHGKQWLIIPGLFLIASIAYRICNIFDIGHSYVLCQSYLNDLGICATLLGICRHGKF